MRDTAAVAGMIYFILIGSSIFTYFISVARIPEQLIASSAASPTADGHHR